MADFGLRGGAALLDSSPDILPWFHKPFASLADHGRAIANQTGFDAGKASKRSSLTQGQRKLALGPGL